MEQWPLFVYGTLKPGGSYHRRFLAGRTNHEWPAFLAGAALYTEGPYPFMVVGAGLVHPEEQVHGVLLAVRPELYAATLRQVDRFEGYEPGNPRNLYERVTATVQTGHVAMTAWVYVAGSQSLDRIRTGHYRKIPGGRWSTRG